MERPNKKDGVLCCIADSPYFGEGDQELKMFFRHVKAPTQKLSLIMILPMLMTCYILGGIMLTCHGAPKIIGKKRSKDSYPIKTCVGFNTCLLF